MQPDPQSRRPYPAFRAWIVRLVAYSVAALISVLGGIAALGLLLDGVPRLAVAAVQMAAAWLLGGLANHVVTTLLHDRREAAWREMRQRHARHTAEGGNDGA